ncbi:MAG: glutamine amidotransferase [Methanothrix sp.]|nr:glutamine amidotransferase [Methanothrix sp.]
MKITYIGDWVFYTGPNFIESPFEMVAKDCQLKFLGKPVTDALEKAGHSTKAYSNWQLYHMSPSEFADILKWSDVLVVSDVEARCFHLNPTFFDGNAYGKSIITFPDRLKQMRDAVEGGMGLIYLGGWLSFSGHMEKGGWRRSPISDWLPFQCLVGEDLMESSEGFAVEAVNTSHPAVAGLDAASIPPLLGYNEFIPREGFEPLWRIKDSGHPLLGVSKHGKGRMVTYGSDPVPHWGINLMLWKDYEKLWQQLAAWAAGE